MEGHYLLSLLVLHFYCLLLIFITYYLGLKQIPVFLLTQPTLRFRADSAIFIAILKKIKRLFTYRPFLCMKILEKIK